MDRILPCRVCGGYGGHVDGVDLSRLRAEYAGQGLAEADLDREGLGADPVALFSRWLDEAIAAELLEANAMAVATATPDGRPSVRTVLLKGVDARGWVFFTHYESRKGRELAANPWAAATMLWHPLQRQVRLEGPVERVDPAESDAYFSSRPRGAQLSAASSPQSTVVPDRLTLERRRDDVSSDAADGPVRRPETWGGYRIGWHTVEFWQGREDRFHDRLRFTRDEIGDWTRERLAP